MTNTKSTLDHELASWIIEKIGELEGRSKFCAHNAIRFLHWANETIETSHIVSSFCAMHATEEAVAAFISAAKAYGHGEFAKKINLHDHLSKALVSILAQRISILASKGKLAVAVHMSGDHLALRIPKGKDGYHFGHLHLSSFRIGQSTERDIKEHTLLGDLPPLEELRKEVAKGADMRNKLLYASNKGFPSEDIDAEASLKRETQLSLGLIWAAVDLRYEHDQEVPFVRDILEQMAAFNELR